jgi:hypothetical protein
MMEAGDKPAQQQYRVAHSIILLRNIPGEIMMPNSRIELVGNKSPVSTGRTPQPEVKQGVL